MRFTVSLLLMADWMTVVVPFTAGSTRSLCGSSTLIITAQPLRTLCRRQGLRARLRRHRGAPLAIGMA